MELRKYEKIELEKIDFLLDNKMYKELFAYLFVNKSMDKFMIKYDYNDYNIRLLFGSILYRIRSIPENKYDQNAMFLINYINENIISINNL